MLSTHGQSALPRSGVVLVFPLIDYPLVSVKKIGFPVCLVSDFNILSLLLRPMYQTLPLSRVGHFRRTHV